MHAGGTQVHRDVGQTAPRPTSAGFDGETPYVARIVEDARERCGEGVKRVSGNGYGFNRRVAATPHFDGDRTVGAPGSAGDTRRVLARIAADARERCEAGAKRVYRDRL
jgi:hypothetical protein